MSETKLDQSKIQPKTPKINELIANIQSVILATVDAEGNPNSSYAPYVFTNGSFYVLVSYMAKHTKNLENQKKVSVMFIDDESATKQIYARNRLTLESEANLVANDSEEWTNAVAALQVKHGKIIEMLSSLNDFVLFELKPIKGSYVNGFGSAYSVNADLSINEHVRGAHGQHNAEKQA